MHEEHAPLRRMNWKTSWIRCNNKKLRSYRWEYEENSYGQRWGGEIGPPSLAAVFGSLRPQQQLRLPHGHFTGLRFIGGGYVSFFFLWLCIFLQVSIQTFMLHKSQSTQSPVSTCLRRIICVLYVIRILSISSSISLLCLYFYDWMFLSLFLSVLFSSFSSTLPNQLSTGL